MNDTEMLSPERFAQLHPRIQAKITAAREAAARREAKNESREALRDWLRHEELRSIPIKDRTPEERNETQRLRRRLDKHKKEAKVAINERVTLEEFWTLNRASVLNKIPAWREQEEKVLDQIFWMAKGWATSPHSPDFVSLEEGLEDLDEFVSEFGLIRDDVYDSPLLKDIVPFWSVWDGFWRDPEILRELCQESPATEIFCKYGIRTALSAYEVRTFKQRIAEHERAKTHSDVRSAHLQFESDRCWLCKAWEQQQADIEGKNKGEGTWNKE